MKVIHKRCKSVHLALLLNVCLMYNAASAQINITRAEWYVDADPGYGNAQSINIANPPNFSFSMKGLDTLRAGLHVFGIRSQDANGAWSFDERWLFQKPAVLVNAPAIIAGEWYLDTDPGYGNGQSVSLVNLPDLSFQYLRLDTLRAGLHVIGMRSKDENGAWSLDEHWLLLKPPAVSPLANIVQAEYYLDVDTGYGRGTPIPIAEQTDLINLAIPNVVAGHHFIGIRSKDANGSWSLDEIHVITPNGPLPVTGLDISAQKAGSKILVSWTTLTESNTKEFIIEKSADGINFRAAGSTAAKGHSTTKNNYTFSDTKPLEGVNYYRIKQLDLDGKYVFSATATVLFEPSNETLTLYPNPADSKINIRFNSVKPKVLVKIYDEQGRLVKIDNVPANNPLQLNINDLKAGTYNILIRDNERTEYGKFIKR